MAHLERLDRSDILVILDQPVHVDSEELPAPLELPVLKEYKVMMEMLDHEVLMEPPAQLEQRALMVPIHLFRDQLEPLERKEHR